MGQNKIKLFKLLRYICLVCVFSLGYITIVATGGGGGGGSPSSSTDGGDTTGGDTTGGDTGGTTGGDTATVFTISGLASKGLVSGGTVNVYKVTDDGQKGESLGSTTTDSDGAYSVDIGDYDGPVLVEVTGGTYIDEATGETKALDGTLRAALPSVSGDVDVAITPLTEIAVRIAEAGGGLDPVKITDANELLSQLIGDNADIISTMPADSNDDAAFGGASEDAKNYALLLAGISQMSATSLQDVSAVIDAIEDDIRDLMLDQTSTDLSAAINDFIAGDYSPDVTDATALTEEIDNFGTAGLQPTGDLADLKGYLVDFLKDATEENYDSFMYYMSNFTPQSAEAYLFKAMAELMDIYNNEAVGFLTDNEEGLGLNFDSLYNETINSDDFLFNLLNLAALDEDIAGLFADLETRLGAVYSDLANAEGARISISLTGFDTIYLDDIDVKILKTITSELKSVCILVQAIDLKVVEWMLDGPPGADAPPLDMRIPIAEGWDVGDPMIADFLDDNPDLFTYSDLTKRASFVTALAQTADDLEAVVDALYALGIDGRVARLENAFSIDSDLDFYMAKAVSEKTMPSILGAIAASDAQIVFPEDEYVGGSIVLESDGYSYFQSEYDIHLITLNPVAGAITLNDLFNGNNSFRDLIGIEDDPYVEGSEQPDLYQGGVEEIDWDNPIESFTIPEATITINGDESDWENVPVFQSGQGFTVKIARGDGETFYVYASIPTEFNTEENGISCGIGAHWSLWPVEPDGNDFNAFFNYDAVFSLLAIEATNEPIPPGEVLEGPPPGDVEFVAEENMALIEEGGSIVGMEVKFNHFDLMTRENYINSFHLVRSVGGPPPILEPIIQKGMIKLY